MTINIEIKKFKSQKILQKEVEELFNKIAEQLKYLETMIKNLNKYKLLSKFASGHPFVDSFFNRLLCNFNDLDQEYEVSSRHYFIRINEGDVILNEQMHKGCLAMICRNCKHLTQEGEQDDYFCEHDDHHIMELTNRCLEFEYDLVDLKEYIYKEKELKATK